MKIRQFKSSYELGRPTLSKQEPPIQLSEAEIRATYAQGEEAVLSLATL
jgi:hypothetical protein